MDWFFFGIFWGQGAGNGTQESLKLCMLSKSSTTEFRSQHSEIIFKSINLKKIVIEEPLPRKIILLIQCRNELVFEFPAPPFHALMSRLMSSLILWSGSVVCSHSFPCLIILHMLQVPSIKLS